MKSYTRIYMKFFGYQIAEDIVCELCNNGTPAQDCHHIHGRGLHMDAIENLMALCRTCHTRAHNELIGKDELQAVHDEFMGKNY